MLFEYKQTGFADAITSLKPPLASEYAFYTEKRLNIAGDNVVNAKYQNRSIEEPWR